MASEGLVIRERTFSQKLADSLHEARRPQSRAALMMVAIPMLLFLLFSVYPLLSIFYYAFTDFSTFGLTTDWMGLANFREAFADELFWTMWRNTFTFTAISIPGQLIVGFLAAVLLDRKIRGISAFRTIYYMPALTSSVAIGMFFRFIFHPKLGLANELLKVLGLPTSFWLADPKTAMPTIALTAIWAGFGSNMIIYLAGLQGIPTSFYEAAEVDGANWVQKLTRITWPLLRPVTFYLLVTGVIGSVQVYSYIMIMTSDPRGGPLDSTTTVVYEIYKNVVLYNRIGYASAISLVLFIVIMVLTAINFRFAGESLEY